MDELTGNNIIIGSKTTKRLDSSNGSIIFSTRTEIQNPSSSQHERECMLREGIAEKLMLKASSTVGI
jgi:hypothetical protein